MNTREILIVGILSLACLISAVAVIDNKHSSRMLFKQTRAMQQLIDQSRIDWGRLQIEESTLARFGRIEELAVKQLRMHTPEQGEIKTVLR